MKKEAGHGFGSLKLKIKFGGETVSTTQLDILLFASYLHFLFHVLLYHRLLY